MERKYRQFFFWFLAALTYLIIHEGVHFIQALIHDNFNGFRFNGLGVEVLITEPLTIGGWQLAFFSGLSSVVTVLIGYLILALTTPILSLRSQFVKNYFYYLALILLLLDPLYISVLSFFVGGDINGIAMGLGIPYMGIRIVFLIILLFNIYLVTKTLYPRYTEDFRVNAAAIG